MIYPPQHHIEAIVIQAVTDADETITAGVAEVIAGYAASTLTSYPEDIAPAAGSEAHRILTALADAPDGLTVHDLQADAFYKERVAGVLSNLTAANYALHVGDPVAPQDPHHRRIIITGLGMKALDTGRPQTAPTLDLAPGTLTRKALTHLAENPGVWELPDIAEQIGEPPWSALRALDALTTHGYAVFLLTTHGTYLYHATDAGRDALTN